MLLSIACACRCLHLAVALTAALVSRYSKKSNVTAASAAVAVMPKPTSGFCPWLMAKEVITLAPKAATTTEPSQSFCELLYITVVCDLWVFPSYHPPLDRGGNRHRSVINR